ncbi:hypothetical protein [Actinokineospora cianjurensis]|uniref:Integral membrane protein n=1 Tax=Actinokineospora cianjurensis TaxID=585224 RepID=A0A421B9N7_9PSEU|nr:hypothetical protein [Actinokineospora cianjurensis]RLK61262.1 hypothetical protein CLV68_1781 [Actinokineospora cianjurensis]
MIDVLSPALTWVSVGAAVWALVLVLLNRPLPIERVDGKAYLALLALIELGLLTQAVLGFIKLAGADHDVPGLSYGGYLLGSLLILPVALYWSLAERTRWGTAVLVVGTLVIPVMIVRMGQVWAHG